MARPLWFVLPIEVKIDPAKGEIFGEPEQDIPIEIDPNNLVPQRRGLAQPRPRNAAIGCFIGSSDKREFDRAFYSEEAAQTYAREQATLRPKTPFGVFSCIGIYETTTPSVIEKEFNTDGELRVKGK